MYIYIYVPKGAYIYIYAPEGDVEGLCATQSRINTVGFTIFLYIVALE